MRFRSWLGLSLLFLPLLAPPAGAAPSSDGRFYARWTGEVRFPIGEEFLQRSHWDFRPSGTPEALPAVQIVSAGDPGAAGEVLEAEPLGSGTVAVPPGEFPAILRRERVRTDQGIAIQYRWIASGNVTLALVRGPVGTAGPGFESASLVERLEAGTPEAGLRVYRDRFITPDTFDTLVYAIDVSPSQDPAVTVPLSGLTTQGYSTGAAMATATTWDFTPAASLPHAVIAQTDVPVSAAETCNFDECGYIFAGTDYISRQDNLTSGAKTTAAFDISPAGDRIYLRAGSQYEGTNSENRFCYDGATDRGEVPQYVFPNLDGARYYMQLGDPAWTGTTFTCDLNLFNTNCGADEPLKPRENRVNACQDHTGRFNFLLTSEGTAKLPSGHWADVLVMRQVADFCVYFASSSCGNLAIVLQRVRQPVILFLSPTAGSVVQVNGPLLASDFNTWTGVNESLIQVALLPPLSIQLTGATDTTVSLSWDPGNQMGYVDRAKVYWDTDSGGATAYAFNSDTHPGQVTFGTNSATISGLTAGQAYFITVTLLDSFTEPGSNPPLTLEYESFLFPKTFGGNGATYPVEIQAATAAPGCTPTGEVQNLRIDHAAGGQQIFTWDPLADPCVDHYVLLGAASPSIEANFTTVTQTAGTSFTGNPASKYYIVAAEGVSGQRGPLGHYGQ